VTATGARGNKLGTDSANTSAHTMSAICGGAVISSIILNDGYRPIPAPGHPLGKPGMFALQTPAFAKTPDNAVGVSGVTAERRAKEASRTAVGSVRIAQLSDSLICYFGLAKSGAARDDSLSPPAAARGPKRTIPHEEDRNGQ
jgi:hypothetical protein